MEQQSRTSTIPLQNKLLDPEPHLIQDENNNFKSDTIALIEQAQPFARSYLVCYVFLRMVEYCSDLIKGKVWMHDGGLLQTGCMLKLHKFKYLITTYSTTLRFCVIPLLIYTLSLPCAQGTKYINLKQFKYANPVYVTGTYRAPLRIQNIVHLAAQRAESMAGPMGD